MDLAELRNPVWAREDNLRDPAVLPVAGGYLVFYSRFSNRDWTRPENWAVACAFTPDFVHFEHDRDITPKGFASPGDPIFWHGRYLLPLQSYPTPPARLHLIESPDARHWSTPRPFLTAANGLPWNTHGRVIDPCFVVDGATLHCYFVGSCDTETPGRHANLLGHAVTTDADLADWEILSLDAPLIGRSSAAYDGVENVAIFRTGAHWTMIYSEGLADQHLAYAQSDDLRRWTLRGPLALPRQRWMARKHGAPFVWPEGDGWHMILMGQADDGRTRFGLLTSTDGVNWTPLPERAVDDSPGNPVPQLGNSESAAELGHGVPEEGVVGAGAELGLGAPEVGATGKGWYSRGYLPHFDSMQVLQSITFRLADSLPQEVLRRLEAELAQVVPEQQEVERRKRVEAWLDAGLGCCALAHPQVAAVVQETLAHFEPERYGLIAWCVMPNHVHVLIQPRCPLAKIVQSWKSYTGRWALARNAELGLGVPGKAFWMRDYWDRFIRNERHFDQVIEYIHMNPVMAGLCDAPYAWRWSSAYRR